MTKQLFTSIILGLTIATAIWIPNANAQTFFEYTGTYQPAAQQTAIVTCYMHDNLDTSPLSAMTVVNAPSDVNGNYNRGLFGNIAVFDDALTTTSDPNSMLVGRGRGFYVFNSMDPGVSALEFVWTAVFNENSDFPSSTLTFKGYDAISLATREIVITGGTGQFRLARGWATITTAWADGGAANLKITAYVFYGV